MESYWSSLQYAAVYEIAHRNQRNHSITWSESTTVYTSSQIRLCFCLHVTSLFCLHVTVHVMVHVTSRLRLLHVHVFFTSKLSSRHVSLHVFNSYCSAERQRRTMTPTPNVVAKNANGCLVCSDSLLGARQQNAPGTATPNATEKCHHETLL